MSRKVKQLEFFKKGSRAHGGTLYRKSGGRCPRPLDTKNSMHLVLRSSKARGEWSFLRPKNKELINGKLFQFSNKFGVKVLSLANVGNHLHFHLRLTNRHTYRPFIRALTASIAMGVTGRSRWNKGRQNACGSGHQRLKFWDLRPFTRVLQGFQSDMALGRYLEINKLEGLGVPRELARCIIEKRWNARAGPLV